MPSILSNYAGNTALTALLKGTTYLALHVSAPPVASNSGALATELAGGGYIRQKVTWSTPSAKGTVTTNRLQFSGLPASTITHFAVWDLVSNGRLLVVIPLSPLIGVDDSQALIAEVGDIGIVV